MHIQKWISASFIVLLFFCAIYTTISVLSNLSFMDFKQIVHAETVENNELTTRKLHIADKHLQSLLETKQYISALKSMNLNLLKKPLISLNSQHRLL